MSIPGALERSTPRSVAGAYPVQDEAAVRGAVASARKAAVWWEDLGFDARRDLLLAWKRNLVRRIDELAQLVHVETGKPLDDARLEIVVAIDHIDWAATHAAKVLGPRRVRPGLLGANLAASVEYQPLGVVGVIGPWNYPVLTPMGSIAYALAAGNAVVFKPSEHATSTGVWLAEAFAQAVPKYPVLHVVAGFGDTGAALCTVGVDKLSFTGSTATAKRVLASCAKNLTPVLIEAGGKDAAIICADADIDAAADAVAYAAMANAGQACIGIERAYVEASVYDEFVRKLAHIASAIRVGPGPDAEIGLITLPEQVHVIARHIDDALARGGRAVVGGADSVQAPFVYPVVLVDVPDDSDAICEETFGPTVTVSRVAGPDEAVAKANASRYGLGAAVFCRDTSTATAIARRLRCGMVCINGAMAFALVPALPFGGTGDSGFGRIHGPDGLREFTRAKAVTRQRFRSPITTMSFTRSRKDVARVIKLIRLVHGKGKSR